MFLRTSNCLFWHSPLVPGDSGESLHGSVVVWLLNLTAHQPHLWTVVRNGFHHYLMLLSPQPAQGPRDCCIKCPGWLVALIQFVGHLESTFHNLLIPPVIYRLLFTARVSILTLVSISENASLFSDCSFFHNRFFFPVLSQQCPLLSPKNTNYRPAFFFNFMPPSLLIFVHAQSTYILWHFFFFCFSWPVVLWPWTLAVTGYPKRQQAGQKLLLWGRFSSEASKLPTNKHGWKLLHLGSISESPRQI